MCLESPQTWFEDVMVVYLDAHGHGSQYLDPTFVETVESGSLCVVSAVADMPAMLGAEIRSDLLLIQSISHIVPPNKVTVLVRGLRKGYRDVRFPRFTADQMQHNTEFWDRAYQ